jgi:sugar phosphate isomerase/epimerase
MERKLGINSSCIVGREEKENLRFIKEVGFQSFFSGMDNIQPQQVCAIKNESVKLGLDYEFMHGPFSGINELWTREEPPKIFNDFMQAIDSASEAGVKTVVTHVSSSFTPPEINALGLSRFDKWVERALQKGVTLAFENQRRLGNFAYIMDRYEKAENVKYCYDCGHEHCFTLTVPFVPIYKSRLICTHLHDNFGRNDSLSNGGDLHLLPFDGNIDYDTIVKSFVEANYQGSFTLEVFSDSYPNLSLDDFLKEAYNRAEKLLKIAESLIK